MPRFANLPGRIDDDLVFLIGDNPEIVVAVDADPLGALMLVAKVSPVPVLPTGIDRGFEA